MGRKQLEGDEMLMKDDVDTNSVKKRDWTPMRVASIGKATDLIKGGGGKLSAAGGDPGEGKKQQSG